MKEESDQSVELANGENTVSQISKQNLTSDTQGKKKSKKKRNLQMLIANLIDTQYPVVKKVVKGMLGMKIIKDAECDDWDVYWTDNAVTSQQLGRLKPYQKINHFPGMYTLSRKNYLARNLIKMEKQFPNDYNFFPKTWVLPSELNQLRNFMERQNNAVLIVKPEASSQGRGIFLTKSFQDFQFGEHYVVQKYLKRPFLIDGLKFDLRVYALVAGCEPLRVYIYKEGLARFATEPYCSPKKQNLNNLYMHLTNYAINKNNQKFQFNNSTTEMDKGHKRSLTSILQKLQQLGHDASTVWEQIKQCIAKTIISAQPLLAHQYKSSQPTNYANNMCFQILGFDIILDHNLKPQILQVNYTPSFTTDTPLDFQIKKSLIHDSLVLMNTTSKAKNEIINEKKKEMKERTLTGKAFYHTKQSRNNLINQIQKFRNSWESQHLGNFQRVFPVFVELPTNKQIKKKFRNSKFSDVEELSWSQDQVQIDNDQQNSATIRHKQAVSSQQQQKQSYLKDLQQKYNSFLDYSVSCYLVNTGANVRRNIKVIPQCKSQSIGMMSQEYLQKIQQLNELANSSQAHENFGKQVPCSQIIKFTNTQNLQKIYRTKLKPMVYKKNNYHSKPDKVEENAKQMPSQSSMLERQRMSCGQYKQQKKKGEKPKNNKFISIYTMTNKMYFKNKSNNIDTKLQLNKKQKIHHMPINPDIYETRKVVPIIQSIKFRTGSSLRKATQANPNIQCNELNN